MSLNLKPVEQQTIVITGASSGIGLATALDAARRGARLLLISRDPVDLEAAAEQCRGLGAQVETLAADVADRAVLELAAETAADRFGGFDTWVNNAGASAYGELKVIPEEDARQIFETNYWGTVHGSLVAAEHFRGRMANGVGGALINVGSVLSDRAVPLQGHYCATKHAIKAFTDALRMELDKEGVPVSVTLVKPSAINTPYPEHAANYMGVEPDFPAPVYEPEVVGRAILRAAESPQRDVTVGAQRGFALLGGLFPALTDKYMVASAFDDQQGDAPAEPTKGSLHEPQPGDARMHGTYEGRTQKSSAYTWVAQNVVEKPMTVATISLFAGLAIALAAKD